MTALRLLAQRRLTAAQLHDRLARRGFADEAVTAAVESCRRDGLVDDRLFATLYVAAKRGAVGDARLVAELVKRGIAREVARSSVASAEANEETRASAAYEKIRRTQPSLSYPSAARKLERLGFPAAVIYRILRERAGAELHDVIGDLS